MTTQHTGDDPATDATPAQPPLSREQQTTAFADIALIVLSRQFNRDGIALTEEALDGALLVGYQPAVAAMAALMPLTREEYRHCQSGTHAVIWLAAQALGLGTAFTRPDDAPSGGADVDGDGNNG